MFANRDVKHFDFSNVLAFCVPSCDAQCDFSIIAMFPFSLPPVVCRRFSCLIYVICICLRIVVSNTYCVVFHSGVQHMLCCVL